MITARDDGCKRIFSSPEFLTAKQTTIIFSRLGANRSLSVHSHAPVNSNEDEDGEAVITDMSFEPLGITWWWVCNRTIRSSMRVTIFVTWCPRPSSHHYHVEAYLRALRHRERGPHRREENAVYFKTWELPGAVFLVININCMNVSWSSGKLNYRSWVCSMRCMCVHRDSPPIGLFFCWFR